MICIDLAWLSLIPLHGVLILIVLVFEICQAQTACELARQVTITGTAASKTILSWLDSLAKSILVDKPKFRWKYLTINFINDGDWYGLMSGKRSNLAPVAINFFVVISLRITIISGKITGLEIMTHTSLPWKKKCCFVASSIMGWVGLVRFRLIERNRYLGTQRVNALIEGRVHVRVLVSTE